MKLSFQSLKRLTPTIVSVCFNPSEPLNWQAGQSIRLELPVGYDTEERRFTISSAPHTGVVEITTRLSQSKFKQSLASLQPGASVYAYAVEGDFLWQSSPHPLLFIASGLGITPFMSMLRQRAHELQPLAATLVYAGKSSELIFGDELRDLQRRDANFTVEFLPDQRISVELITQHCGDFRQRLVYVAGPEVLTRAISAELVSRGLEKPQLKQDIFTGE